MAGLVDGFLAHTRQASAHARMAQKNNKTRCSDLGYNQPHALVGMFRGQRSTQGKGPSGFIARSRCPAKGSRKPNVDI